MTYKPITDQEALDFHAKQIPGKLEITPIKPLVTQRDLALAYSPGVAIPCEVIVKNPEAVYELTVKGNLVAVISNGTAVLGLGNLGALASKPVMEGKAVLFKRFAAIDSIDLEVDTQDVDAFINAIKLLEPSFGGINLEDIKAPECFLIEDRLKKEMSIPVFHDDQHGTAVIAAAGLINALELANKKISNVHMVINGAGAAAIACANLILSMGLKKENLILCDSRGVIYKGRGIGMNQWKEPFALETEARSLKEAIAGADVFLGVSVRDALTANMLLSMAKTPIVFALANPHSEITPELAKKTRQDVIIATGRSDHPNQVNNLLGFPYIFRGALDVRASTINEEMKIAAAKAIATLAKEPVPDEVSRVYKNDALQFGPNYIIPTPFDPRLLVEVSSAVAQAAMASHVARKPIENITRYKQMLAAKLDATTRQLSWLFENIHQENQHLLFAEGEQANIIQAAVKFQQDGFGSASLIGDKEKIYKQFIALNIPENCYPAILNKTANVTKMGLEYLSAQKIDGLILGGRENYIQHFKTLLENTTHKKSQTFAYSLAVCGEQITLIADPAIHKRPNANDLVHMAIRLAAKAKSLGLIPQIAFISYSNFEKKAAHNSEIIDAIKLLDAQQVNFIYDGEMSIDAAFDPEFRKRMNIKTHLQGKANILIMPSLETAHITTKLLKYTNHKILGPLLIGLDKIVQIATANASVKEIEHLAALTAHQAILDK